MIDKISRFLAKENEKLLNTKILILKRRVKDDNKVYGMIDEAIVDYLMEHNKGLLKVINETSISK